MVDNLKEVIVNLPSSLVQEIDGYLKQDESSRSDFFREATRLYLEEMRRKEIRRELRKGYEKMSSLNRELADEGIEYDARLMSFYEDSLAESE